MQSIRRPLAAATIAAAVLGTTAAMAAASDIPSPDSATVQQDTRSTAAIERYWTAERMKRARPTRIRMVERDKGSIATRRPDAIRRPPAGRRGSAGGHRSRLGSRRPIQRRSAPPGTSRARSSYSGLAELPWRSTSHGTAGTISSVGRLYYRGYDRRQGVWYDSFCTGTLVSANIVMTAAHCIREGRPDGVRYHSFTFAPGVDGSSRPYGTFESREQVTPTSWFSAPFWNSRGTGNQGFWGQDYAFVILKPDASGRHAGATNMAGAYSFYMGAPTGSVYHLGYPSEGGWNGCWAGFCRPWHCASPIQTYPRYDYGNKADVGYSCYTTGGASGGPNFQAIGGRWYITSVLSHMGVVHCQRAGNPCPRYGLTFYGAYLDDDALSIFNYARSI